MVVDSSDNKFVGIRNAIVFSITFLLSAFGYEFLFFILTVHVYDISHKAFSVGIFTALTFVPKIFSPFYGIIVDRYDRKVILGINAGVVSILVFALGFINQIEYIYILWFITTIFIMFINNARTALMTEVMPKDNYLWGNSLVLAILNAAKLLAPLIAGLIMLLMDIKALILFSSAVYFICFIMSLLLKLEEREKIEIERVSETFFYLKEGIQYILSNRGIKSLGTVGVVWRLFLGMQFSLFIVYITKYLGKSEVEYGFFMSTIALGSLVGSLLGPFIAKKFSDKALVSIGLTLHFISFSLLGLIKQYDIALIIGFISFLIFYVTVVAIHSIRDISIKANIRGRVYGSITSVLTPPTIISMLVAGYMADVFGVEKVFVFSGLLAVLFVIFIMSNFKVPIQQKVDVGKGDL